MALLGALLRTTHAADGGPGSCELLPGIMCTRMLDPSGCQGGGYSGGQRAHQIHTPAEAVAPLGRWAADPKPSFLLPPSPWPLVCWADGPLGRTQIGPRDP